MHVRVCGCVCVGVCACVCMCMQVCEHFFAAARRIKVVGEAISEELKMRKVISNILH